MPVAASDITLRLSGGASNSDVNASIGGAKSSVAVNLSTIMNNLFDNVSDSEALAGDIEYRCFYVHNGHATDTLTNPKLYIASQTPSADTVIAVGAGVAAAGSTETAVANENTAPASVTFSAAANEAAAIDLGASLGPGQGKAVWVRRTVSAGAAPVSSDQFTLRIVGTP